MKPGGFLYLAESHPNTLCLEMIDGKIVPHYPWRTAMHEPEITEDATSYNGDATPMVNRRNYSWLHPLSDIVNAVIAGGMTLEWLHEHEGLTWPMFPVMTAGPDRLYRLPPEYPPLAMSFSLRAVKSGKP